jgi:hypothetical protein
MYSSSKKFFAAILAIVFVTVLLVAFAFRDKTIARNIGSSLIFSAGREEKISIFDLDSIDWELVVVDESEIGALE